MNEKKYVLTSDLSFAIFIFQVAVSLTVKLINKPFLQNDRYLSLCLCLHSILSLETILTAITNKT